MSLFTEKSEELLSRGQLTVIIQTPTNGGVAIVRFKIMNNEILIIYKVAVMYLCTSLKFILGYVLSHKRRYTYVNWSTATHFSARFYLSTLANRVAKNNLAIYRHVITE